jgi:hypothetical protein
MLEGLQGFGEFEQRRGGYSRLAVIIPIVHVKRELRNVRKLAEKVDVGDERGP